MQPDLHVSPGQWSRVLQAMQQRLQGHPVSRILGRREFYGRSFAISPAVLDPRPDSETLIDLALQCIAEDGRIGNGPPLRMLDIGTGSGCLLLTLLSELPGACGVGLDISPEACAVAQENALQLGLDDHTVIEACDA